MLFQNGLGKWCKLERGKKKKKENKKEEKNTSVLPALQPSDQRTFIDIKYSLVVKRSTMHHNVMPKKMTQKMSSLHRGPKSASGRTRGSEP